MKKNIISIALVLCLALSLLGILLIVSAKSTEIDYIGVDWQSGLAGEVVMPTLDENAAFSDTSGGSGASVQITPPVGTWVYDWYVGALSGNPYIQLRGIGQYVEVWVANEDALKFAEGDPRNDDPKNWQITDEMVEFLIEEFDTIIYPTCVYSFGAPVDRDGTGTIFEALGWPSYIYNWIATDNPQRVILKIFNIQDDNYNDPTYPSYVVGFYSSTYTKSYYQRNMVHIDNWRWWQRLGEEGTQWYPVTNPELTVTRPYVYDSTVAHEYQHNIHSDWNPGDDSFMNEGCSMYAEVVCGYGIDVSYLNYYFYSPDNSLTEWSDQGNINILADYGVAALWTVYLSDHYGGGDFIRHFVQSGIPGIEGINAALFAFGFDETFDDVYHDWRLANLLREDSGPYSYTTLDLNDPEVNQIFTNHVPGLQWTYGTDFGTTITIRGYDTGVSALGNYGTDYILMDSGFGEPRTLYFDGGDSAIVPGWTLTANVWYSGAADLMNTLLISEAYVDPADPTLEITTYWDIEDYWDFGFTQISTDGGETWTSLENVYTTYDHDPSAHPDIVANLPGLTSWSGFIDPDGWITMDFDLSPYSGETVLVGFRYMTDWAVNYEGWFINDAVVSGTPLNLAPYLPEADFLVTVVHFYADGFYVIEEMTLDDATETGECIVDGQKPDYTVLLVSSVRTQGFVDYLFKATPITSSAWD